MPTQLNRLVIPRFKDEFCQLLQSRLHAVTRQFINFEHPYTLFINIVDRSDSLNFENKDLICAGIERQRRLLEEALHKQNGSKKLLACWNKIERTAIPKTSRRSRATLMMNKFNAKALSLQDVTVNYLRDYFHYNPDAVVFEENISKFSEYKKAEYAIINQYFTIPDDCYISIPLFQFAYLDGAVHIVFTIKDKSNMNYRDGKARLIKTFSHEYESLLLNWDVVDRNAYRRSPLKRRLDELHFIEHYDVPILQELNFKRYYKESMYYLQKRISQNDEIPDEVRKLYRKTAVISILLDSYAHNISAHSLVGLSWLIKCRTEFLQNATRLASSKLDKVGFIYSDQYHSSEFYPLVRFLMDKGAFWTGLLREQNFGGSSSSLYSLLWHDFANNPLYLGTIAASEGIYKLILKVTVLERREKGANGIQRTKHIKMVDGEPASGNLAEINLTQPRKITEKSAEHLSHYVRRGNKHEILKKALLNCRAFFPSGIVGKHSFFTILENEIRNVKHFSESALEGMRNKGLVLHLSVEPTSYNKNRMKEEGTDRELYKIGVWIESRVSLSKKLVLKKIARIEGDIMDTNYKPKLGGSMQDKVCAAMLFNNSFVSVQNKKTPRDLQYYPWVKSGCGEVTDNKYENRIVDYEISSNRYKENKDYFDEELRLPKEGYLKKFFHLWQAKPVLYIDEDKLLEIKRGWENVARFRFVVTNKKYKFPKNQLIAHGLIRIISSNVRQLHNAYRRWFLKWFKRKWARINFRINKQIIAQIVYSEEGTKFYNVLARKELYQERKKVTFWHRNYEQQDIYLAHGALGKEVAGAEVCRFRSHGILRGHYCQGQPIEDAEMSDALASELFEHLHTRIAIFDNRIEERVSSIPIDVLEKQLKCGIYREDIHHWQRIKSEGFYNYHFLVLHLSFIEKLGTRMREEFNESNINQFIKKEILDAKGKPPNNFYLVITTGRGRTEWWSNLDWEYKQFTTFRAVESLISATELAASLEDDFELKYRLSKALFGS